MKRLLCTAIISFGMSISLVSLAGANLFKEVQSLCVSTYRGKDSLTIAVSAELGDAPIYQQQECMPSLEEIKSQKCRVRPSYMVAQLMGNTCITLQGTCPWSPPEPIGSRCHCNGEQGLVERVESQNDSPPSKPAQKQPTSPSQETERARRPQRDGQTVID